MERTALIYSSLFILNLLNRLLMNLTYFYPAEQFIVWLLVATLSLIVLKRTPIEKPFKWVRKAYAFLYLPYSFLCLLLVMIFNNTIIDRKFHLGKIYCLVDESGFLSKHPQVALDEYSWFAKRSNKRVENKVFRSATPPPLKIGINNYGSVYIANPDGSPALGY